MIARIPISKVDPSPYQARHALDQDVIGGMVHAIETEGDYPKAMAVTVRPKDGRCELISGHHRTEAARRAGLIEIWAFVQELSDREAAIEVSAMNNQKELTVVEHGAAIAKLVEDFGFRIADYANMMGKGQRWGYSALNAYKALMAHGGWNGPYAKVPALVLEEVRRIEDHGKQAKILAEYLRTGARSTLINQVVTLVKDGERVERAFQIVRSKDKRDQTSRSNAVVLAEDASDPSASSKLLAWSSAAFSRQEIEKVETYVNILEAQLMAFEELYGETLDRERFGKLVRKHLGAG